MKSQNSKEKLFLEILSPEGTIYNDIVDSVSLPSYTGEITVLRSHAPLYSRLSGGEVKIIKDGFGVCVAISGGFLEVSENKVSILADFAEKSENIISEKAEEAKSRAEEILKKTRNKKDYIMAEKELRKSLIEIKIAEKVKRKRISKL